jgi:hypothetical protein
VRPAFWAFSLRLSYNGKVQIPDAWGSLAERILLLARSAGWGLTYDGDGVKSLAFRRLGREPEPSGDPLGFPSQRARWWSLRCRTRIAPGNLQSMVTQPVATLGKQADGFGNLLRQRMIRVS